MTFDCSIIIPNYNGAKLLPLFLPSVIAENSLYPGRSEIIVVDDASSDSSLRVLTEGFPEVRLVRHEINQGFAEAIHSGVAVAQYELVFLLNSDVKLMPGCLERLSIYFNQPQTFAVNPLIRNQDGHINRSCWTRSRFVRGHLKLLPWDAENLARMRHKEGGFPTLYCSGGSVMLRKSMFESLHGFSELYKPFYYEDFDLGLCAWYRGWTSHFDPVAEVIHADKGTIEDNFKSDMIKSTQRRNRYKMEWSHFSWPRLLCSTLPYSLLQLLGELILLDKKNLRAFRDACCSLGAIRRHRKSLGSGKYSLAEVIELTSKDN